MSRRGLSTNPFASSGGRTTCTVCSDEPSPRAAKATRFCLRTVRTKPFRVSVSPEAGVWCEEGLNRAAIVRGASVELQRGRHNLGEGRKPSSGLVIARKGNRTRAWRDLVCSNPTCLIRGRRCMKTGVRVGGLAFPTPRLAPRLAQLLGLLCLVDRDTSEGKTTLEL